MRISFALAQEKTLRNLNRKQEAIDRLSTSVVTGKRILKPSDDPNGWAQAMDTRETVRGLNGLSKNIDFAVSWGQVTASALSHLSDLLVRIKEIAIYAQGAPSDEKKHALASELDQILQEALSLASTQHGDRYVFNGLKDNAVAPFTQNSDGTFTYNGDDRNTGKLVIRTARNGIGDEPVNVTGDELFEFTKPDATTGNLFREISDLKNAILNEESSVINDKMGSLDAARQNVSAQETIVGTRLASFENRQQALEALKVDHQVQLSTIEEADMIQVITELQQKRTAFEAALQVTVMMKDLNLTRYL